MIVHGHQQHPRRACPVLLPGNQPLKFIFGGHLTRFPFALDYFWSIDGKERSLDLMFIFLLARSKGDYFHPPNNVSNNHHHRPPAVPPTHNTTSPQLHHHRNNTLSNRETPPYDPLGRNTAPPAAQYPVLNPRKQCIRKTDVEDYRTTG
jgi:hypothetical protein